MKVALFTWAFIQSFLTGGLLLVDYRNKANKCLSLFFLLVGIKVLGQYLMRFTAAKFSAPSIIFLADVIDFIEPVLLLFYLRVLFDLPTGGSAHRFVVTPEVVRGEEKVITQPLSRAPVAQG